MENNPVSQPKNNKILIAIIVVLVIVYGVSVFWTIQRDAQYQEEIKILRNNP